MLRQVSVLGGRPATESNSPEFVNLRELFLSKEEVSVGRAREADIKLDSALLPLFVSRSHARITRDPSVAIIDEGSTNLTFVNGVRAPPSRSIPLRDGDVVTFGAGDYVMRDGERLENPFRFVYEDTAAPGRSSRRRAREEDELAREALSASRRRLALERQNGRSARAWLEATRRLLHDSREAAPPAPECEEQKKEKEQQALEIVKQREANRRPSAKAADLLAEECKCAVCLGVMAAPHAVGCGHVFCGKCIMTWTAKQPACPVCRRTALVALPVRALDVALRDVIEPLLDPEEAEDLRRRQAEWEVFRLGREMQLKDLSNILEAR